MSWFYDYKISSFFNKKILYFFFVCDSSPNRTFTFYPALVRFAFGQIEEKEITFDLEKKLHELDVKFVEGEVLHLKPQFRRVQIAGKEFNGDISYDYLVIAMGRRLATEKMPGFFDYANHLLGIKAAKKFGKAVEEKSGKYRRRTGRSFNRADRFTGKF